MLQFLKKITIYGIVIVLALELIVRVFHLHNERPQRFLDKNQVEKWVPNQTGYSVTGNRRQNVGKYRINSFGFNSVYDDYKPDSKEYNIALVGDSFIEGFHTNYDNSLGQQIEKKLSDTKVFEFGYAGYDLVDQLHLIHEYKELFDQMDKVVIYMRYTDDLTRSSYAVSSRLSLNTSINRAIKKVKLLVYLKDIGAISALTNKVGRIKGFLSGVKQGIGDGAKGKSKDSVYLSNFNLLLEKDPLDLDKYVLLIDGRLCSDDFLRNIEKKEISVIDFGNEFLKSQEKTDLVYDQHWSTHGRGLVVDVIADYFKK